MLKSTSVTIHTIPQTNTRFGTRSKLYFDAFIENYDDVFWAGMDITKAEVNTMLEISKGKEPKWPLTDQKNKDLLISYITQHKKNKISAKH